MRAALLTRMIMLERASAQIDGNGQENMGLVCCVFLAWRLSLCTSFHAASPLSSGAKRAPFYCSSTTLHGLNILQSSCAYYYALWDCPRINSRGLPRSINSPPSTSSRTESR